MRHAKIDIVDPLQGEAGKEAVTIGALVHEPVVACRVFHAQDFGNRRTLVYAAAPASYIINFLKRDKIG
jgi:hypothetical protein